MIDERVMLFIDGNNIYGGMKELKLKSDPTLPDFPDFSKLGRLLAQHRKIIRSFFYTGQFDPKKNPVEYRRQSFVFNRIRESCSMRFGRLLQRESGIYIEKGVDVLLTIDMIRLARLNSYDTAILLSGDGDFIETVKEVREMGKRVELAYFPFQRSHELQSACNRCHDITVSMIRMSMRTTMPQQMMVVGK